MFALQITKQQMNRISDDEIESTNMDILPFKIFINPEMKLIGNDTIVRKEGCTSVNGYEADVSRHTCVHVTGYNENGKLVSWEAKDWNARMVQHEMDHLNGIFLQTKCILQNRYHSNIGERLILKKANFGFILEVYLVGNNIITYYLYGYLF